MTKMYFNFVYHAEKVSTVHQFSNGLNCETLIYKRELNTEVLDQSGTGRKTFRCVLEDQRTIGPVNAHLIS